MKKIIALLLVAVMAFAVVGCTSGETAPATNDTAKTETKTESGSTGTTETATAPAEDLRDTVVLAIDQEPPTMCGLNLRSTTPSYLVMMETTQMINELVLAEPGSEFAENVEMALITGYELSEDELTWTFTLKEGMKFAKGNPITAQDIVTTFSKMVPGADADPEAVCKGHYSQFASVDYIDDLHFSITTKDKLPSMMRVLCSYSSGVWDKDLFNNYKLSELGHSYETMNASGPYQLVEWKAGEYMLFEANPYYYTVSVTGENAKTKYLKVVFIPDDTARLMALQSGEVDVVYGMDAEAADYVAGDDSIVVGLSDNCSILNMRFGCNDAIMSNVKVRQAITYALDVNAIADALFGQYYTEVTGFSNYVIWGYLNEGHINQDIEKAKALLAEAGYPDGFSTKIYADTTGYKYVEMAEAVAAQLKNVGINVEVVPVEHSVYQEKIGGCKIEDFDYPLFIKETGGRTREFGSVVHTWYETSPDGTNGAQNNGFYSNAEVDRLSALGNATMDDAERAKIFQQIQHICYLEDQPQVNIAGLVDVYLYSAKVAGLWCNAGGVLEFDQVTVAK